MVTGLLPVTALAAEQPVITTAALPGHSGRNYETTLTATPGQGGS